MLLCRYLFVNCETVTINIYCYEEDLFDFTISFIRSNFT